MKLFIQCPNIPKEWFIIELQGEVSTESNNEEFSTAGLTFADITEREVRTCLLRLS